MLATLRRNYWRETEGAGKTAAVAQGGLRSYGLDWGQRRPYAAPMVGSTMSRVIAVTACGFALAACSMSMPSLDFFRSSPATEVLRVESEPPGADARTTQGQSCRTPCELTVPSGNELAVSFALNGYQPQTLQVRPGAAGKEKSPCQEEIDRRSTEICAAPGTEPSELPGPEFVLSGRLPVAAGAAIISSTRTGRSSFWPLTKAAHPLFLSSAPILIAGRWTLWPISVRIPTCW